VKHDPTSEDREDLHPKGSDRLSALQVENRRLHRQIEQMGRELNRLQGTIDQLPVPVYYMDLDGRYTGCNGAFEQLTGIGRQELMGKTVSAFLPGSEARPHAERDRALLVEGNGEVYETEFPSRTRGATRAAFHKAPLRDPQGQVVGLVGAIVDVTARRQAEESLRQSEEYLRLIFEHSSDGINVVEFDPKTGKRRLVMCNDRYVEMSGYTREALMAADDLNTLVQPYADPRRGQEEYRKILRGVPFSGRGSWIRPDGKMNWYEWTAAPIRVGERVCILGIDRDITEHLRAERELTESRELFSAFMDQLPGSALIKDHGGRVQYVNRYMRQAFGAESRIGKTADQYLPTNMARAGLADDRRARAGGPVTREERILDKHGRPRWYRTRKFAIRRKDRPPLLGCVSFDITESKASEDALRAAERQYRAIVEDQTELICRSLPDTTLTFANVAYAGYFGARPDELIGRRFLEFIPPEDHPRVQSHLAKLGPDHLADSHEHQVIAADGRVRWQQWTNRAILDESGRVAEIQSVGRDVTDLRLAEQALRESRQRLQSIIDNSWDIIFQVDMEGNYTFGNLAAERLTGYSLDELLKMSMYQLAAPEYHQQLARRMRQRATGEDLPQPFGFEIIHKNGRRLFLELTTSPVHKDGKIIGVQGVARDITEHMLAEQQLRAAKERLQYLISASPAVIFSLRVADTIRATYVSDNVTKLFGYAPRQFVEDPDFWMNQIHPDDRPHVQEEIAKSLQTGRFSCEFRARRSDGQYIWVLHEANLIHDEQGKPVEFIGHAIDISELQQTEADLRDSERRYRTLVLNVPGAVYRCACDPEWTMQVISDAIQDISGYPPEDFVANRARSYASIIYPDDRAAVERIVHDGVARRRPYIIEYRVLHADGTLRWVWEKGRGVFDADGQLLCLDGVILDDTERKRAEEALRAVHHQLMLTREEERRRLAAELHDSIGQQLIALHLALKGSLTELRGHPGGQKVEELTSAVERVPGLIRDVRVISHGLYPPTLESLGLASALRQLAGELSGKFTIEVGVPDKLQSARLPSAVEIALFRISQEAVQNALRHGKASHVKVELASGGGQIVLGIVDDGVGFDPQAAMGDGLGLTTMQERADAIGGKIRIESGRRGTRVEVRVPLSLPEQA